MFHKYTYLDGFKARFGNQKVPKHFLEAQEDERCTQKAVLFELSTKLIGVPFWVKLHFQAFAPIKTDSYIMGCSKYHQNISLVVNYQKHMRIICVRRTER